MPTADASRADVAAVVVVVPAHQEQDLVAAAVASVRASLALLSPDVQSEVVVVANGCTDRTAEVARQAGAHVLLAPRADVGQARALGAAWGLARFPVAPARLWIATTDADTVVPADWAPAHLAVAGEGADVFVGTVVLSPADALLHPTWVQVYAAGGAPRREGDGHGHVHGASLGVRADRYLAAGGFVAMPAHEDRDLVERLVRDGAVVRWVDDVPVLTSARRDFRAPDGVGADLAASL